jgi:hypothetical protein
MGALSKEKPRNLTAAVQRQGWTVTAPWVPPDLPPLPALDPRELPQRPARPWTLHGRLAGEGLTALGYWASLVVAAYISLLLTGWLDPALVRSGNLLLLSVVMGSSFIVFCYVWWIFYPEMFEEEDYYSPSTEIGAFGLAWVTTATLNFLSLEGLGYIFPGSVAMEYPVPLSIIVGFAISAATWIGASIEKRVRRSAIQ